MGERWPTCGAEGRFELIRAIISLLGSPGVTVRPLFQVVPALWSFFPSGAPAPFSWDFVTPPCPPACWGLG